MKFVVPSSLTLFILHSVISLADAHDEEGDECPCKFDGNDPDDCPVYGTLDNELKAWPKASQACLDAYQIKKNAPDPTLICTSANSFVNALKNGSLSSSTVKFGLGIPHGGFWKESDTNPDIPVLKDSITIDGTTYNCEASESDCYNAMKPYFGEDEEGMKEMDDVCTQMANAFINARELEQSLLRVRLCSESRENTAIETDCMEMYNAIKSDLEANTDLNCGGFGTGTQNMDIPCSDNSTSNSTTSAAVPITMRAGNLALGLACASVGYLVYN